MNIKDFRKTEQSEEDIRQTYEKYKGFSQNQLMEELIAMVKKQKSEGTFDKDRIEYMLKAIAPNLTQEQRERIDSLLDML